MRNQEAVQAYFDVMAQGVAGWFYPVDMLLFAYIGECQEESGFGGELCEVGVYHGKSLALLGLMAAPGERVFGIDLFIDDNREQTLLTLQRACGREDAAVLITKNSQECTSAFLASVVLNPVRFLHVDAGHEYAEVLADLRNFGSLVSPTGVIAIDDYYDRAFPGVAAAAHAYISHGRSKRFVPFLVGQNKIYLCHPALAAHYQRCLVKKRVFSSDLRLQRMYEHPVLIPFAGKLSADADAILPLLDA